MKNRRDPGELEHAVLAVVAAQPGSMSVTDVLARLSGDPAYTTVMTTLGRLAGKGALVRERDGRAYRYSLAAPADAVDDAVTARRMRRLLGDGSDRAGVLARFVAELDDADEQVLRDILGELDRPSG